MNTHSVLILYSPTLYSPTLYSSCTNHVYELQLHKTGTHWNVITDLWAAAIAIFSWNDSSGQKSKLLTCSNYFGCWTNMNGLLVRSAGRPHSSLCMDQRSLGCISFWCGLWTHSGESEWHSSCFLDCSPCFYSLRGPQRLKAVSHQNVVMRLVVTPSSLCLYSSPIKPSFCIYSADLLLVWSKATFKLCMHRHGSAYTKEWPLASAHTIYLEPHNQIYLYRYICTCL